jgi:4-amino-4-deoxy-L-arabinose transferase-like glycosyltransferase
VARSFWEISALFLLLTFIKEKKWWQVVVAGLCLGAALASKLFVIVLLPFWLVAVVLSSKNQWSKHVAIFSLCALAVVTPFWVHTAQFGGSPWYPLQMGSDALSVIGGANSWSAYIWDQSIKIWWAPWYLSISRDYVSPLIPWCLPLLFLVAWRYRKSLRVAAFWQSRQRLLVLVPIIVGEMAVWWYLPPVSSRYALTGFLCLLMVEVMAVREILSHMKPRAAQQCMKFVVAVWCGAVIFGLLPRMGVAAKTMLWVMRGADKEVYYENVRDGWIDKHLQKWIEISG